MYLKAFLPLPVIFGEESNSRLPVHAQSLSCVWLFAIPWTIACQTPLSMGFFRQEYWSAGYPGEVTFYRKSQTERRGRNTCRIHNDLLILKPQATVISSVKSNWRQWLWTFMLIAFEFNLILVSSYHPLPPSTFKQWTHQVSSEHAPGSLS